jgi:hypothetical protein
MLETNPIEFYFRRLGPLEFAPPKEPQSFPAASGIAFDAYVKNWLASKCKIECPSLQYMLREVSEERDQAILLGAKLLEGYEASGALGSLQMEGIKALALTHEDFAPGTNVPIQTRLDAITGFGVHDWKVKGAGAPGERSPTPGYVRLYDSLKGCRTNPSPHPRAYEAFDTIDPEWATQLTMYSWAIGQPIGESLASVDEVIVGADGRVRVACFRTRITEAFQRQVRDRLIEAWALIREERVLPSEWACMTAEELRVMM